MKRSALWWIALLLSVCPAYAAIYTGSGTVYTLQVHDSSLGTDMDWFSLVGVTSLGTCRTADAGYVALALRDDAKGQRMFTLVLAAKSAGATLTVRVDDTVVSSSGYCYARVVYE